MKSNRRVKKKSLFSRVSVFIALAFVIGFLGFQIISLYSKNKEVMAQEQELQEQLDYEMQRSEALEDKKEYIQTDEYKQRAAREKLGMVEENEIIFREED